MNPQPDYDVAVVGAGPAGSRTAQLLSEAGHRVVLIERDAEPGQPVHCTGIVSHECFERYGLPDWLIVNSVRSFVLRSPSGRSAEVNRKQVQAHVLDRAALDRYLVHRAELAGTVLLASTGIDEIEWNGRGVTLTGLSGGRRLSLSARVAVVATGYGSRLPKSLGLSASSGVISGCQAVVETEDVDQLEVFTGGAFGDGGFGWLVPWKPGLALAGLLTRRRTMDHLRDYLERLRESGRIGAVRELYRCRAIPLGVAEHAVSDGVIGVGDAVGQVKPTSGGGIYYGLLGADAAAETLVVALEAGDLSARGLQPYEHRWRAALVPEIRQGYALRRLIEQLPDSVVESCHRLLGVPGLKRLLLAAAPNFDWHSKSLTNFLTHLRRRSNEKQAATP